MLSHCRWPCQPESGQAYDFIGNCNGDIAICYRSQVEASPAAAPMTTRMLEFRLYRKSRNALPRHSTHAPGSVRTSGANCTTTAAIKDREATDTPAMNALKIPDFCNRGSSIPPRAIIKKDGRKMPTV